MKFVKGRIRTGRPRNWLGSIPVPFGLRIIEPGFIRTHGKKFGHPTPTTTNDEQKHSTSLMLSKILQYARSILTLQKPASPTDLEVESNLLTTAMVTTRRQSGNSSNPTADISPVLESSPQDFHPVSSKKRRRAQVADASNLHATQDDSAPVIPPKRQKLPVRGKDEQHYERRTHIAVEIPVRDITQNNTPMWTASEGRKLNRKTSSTEDTRSSSQARGENYQADDKSNQRQNTSHVVQSALDHVTPSRDALQGTLADRYQRSKRNSPSDRNNKSSPVLVKAVTVSKSTEPKHRRFGSEDSAAEEVEIVQKEVVEVGEEDEYSDDDDPEVLATHDALGRATETARSAARAVQEQDAIIRKKRKKHDERLKEQAKTANKKSQLPNRGTGDSNIATPLDAVQGGGEMKTEEHFRISPRAFKGYSYVSKSRSIITRNNIPEFLPAEYLEDDTIEDQGHSSSVKQAMVHKSKKIKFTDITPEKPKDRRKGSTIYRVAEALGSGLLAPKAAVNARSVKEAWLNGQRGGGRSMKVVKGGFFKNRK